jgi:hypothetical protein
MRWIKGRIQSYLQRAFRLNRRLNAIVLGSLLTSGMAGLSSAASTEIYPPNDRLGFSLPDVVAKASFICKGEVISAPDVRTIRGPLPRKTGIAKLRIDACFKGSLAGVIAVAADEYRPAAGWSGGGHLFTPKTGEHLLLFLRSKGTVYELADDNVGALSVSTRTSSVPPNIDPLENLESDFKAGLQDSDPEVVLKSIRWLGDLQHLHSTAELKGSLKNADEVTRLYLWQTLLKVGDLSIVPEVGRYLDQFDPTSRSYSLPNDRVPYMQFQVFDVFCGVRDPVVTSYLDHFALSSNPRVRVAAIQGLRHIGSVKTAPVFLKALDDHQEDIDFVAMQSLLELAGGGPIAWVPTWQDFLKTPDTYAANANLRSTCDARPKASTISPRISTSAPAQTAPSLRGALEPAAAVLVPK